jgi:hypothetical protein
VANGDQETRDAINQAYSDLAQAVRSLNPSYAIAPVVGRSAASGGSFYIRGRATVVPTQRITNFSVNSINGAQQANSNGAQQVKSYWLTQSGGGVYYSVPLTVPLPPPVILGASAGYGPRYGYGYGNGYGNVYRYGLPWWLYSGTVQLDVDVPVAAAAMDQDEVRALREEIRKLRDQVEKLQKQKR